jgi:hypothetical protein
LTVLFKYEFV